MKKTSKFKEEWNHFKNSFTDIETKKLTFVFFFDLLFFFLMYVGSFFFVRFMDNSSLKAGAFKITSYAADNMDSIANSVGDMTYLAKLVFIGLLVYSLFSFFSWTLSRSLVWIKILNKKFSFKFWMKFSLLQICWFFLFIIPWLLILGLLMVLYNVPVSGAVVFYIYKTVISLLLLAHFLLYMHFTTIIYNKFTETNKIKSMLDGYGLGFSKLKKAFFPNLFVVLVLAIISFISLLSNLMPESFKTIFVIIVLVLFLTWYRLYYSSLIKKWE